MKSIKKKKTFNKSANSLLTQAGVALPEETKAVHKRSDKDKSCKTHHAKDVKHENGLSQTFVLILS